MTYKEFLELLEDLELDLDSASEALDIEILEIEAWEGEDEIPKSAEKWIKKEKVEFVALNNTNEDENFEDEEPEIIDDDEDLDFQNEEEEEEK
tara:strand:- start:3157 stop:3435 length:279 start_codon:yes stop_codon:yes gene_type:complete